MLIDISPLRISRDYRLLFFGQLISAFGSVTAFVVVPVQVYQLTGSTLLVFPTSRLSATRRNGATSTRLRRSSIRSTNVR